MPRTLELPPPLSPIYSHTTMIQNPTHLFLIPHPHTRAHVNLQYSLPLLTCQPHKKGSRPMLRKLAMQMPKLSLTLVALRLNSRSASGMSSIIWAKVFTCGAGQWDRDLCICKR